MASLFSEALPFLRQMISRMNLLAFYDDSGKEMISKVLPRYCTYDHSEVPHHTLPWLLRTPIPHARPGFRLVSHARVMQRHLAVARRLMDGWTQEIGRMGLVMGSEADGYSSRQL